jgi:pteridine reductase
MELKGRVAVVTGAAVRLGRALTLALVRQGVQVAVHYGASADAAEETLAQIKTLGGSAIAIQADLSRTQQLPALLKQAVDHFGRVDILVNSAAIFEPGDVAHTTEEAWDRHFAINLKAPFFLSQAFAAHIGAEQRGHIINIADWRGIRPGADYVAYTLTKAALMAMTSSLALGLAPRIQVNSIAPGAILPPPGQDQVYLDKLAETIPARRSGSPEDIAGAMLYLLQSDFVTGDVIYVTGGQHL